MDKDNLTIIDDGKIYFTDECCDVDNLNGYCRAECDERCNVEFDPKACDCVVTRFYEAMVRVAELEHREGEPNG